MHKVVILGGGFGGLYAAQALRRAPVDLTLVDRRNFHLFQPLLYQVATGSLSPGEICSPIRAVLRKQRNARVLLGEATGLDLSARKLILADGEVPYDTLIVATGARNSYFGNQSWPQFAPGLKSIEDATAVRHKILYAFEAAEREPDLDRRRAWLTFVIVGAGPTGVELAGALAEIARDTLRHDFRAIHPEESRIVLLEGGPHVLPTYPEKLSIDAEQSLVNLGVLPRTNVRVTAIDDASVTLQSGERIETRTVLWAAGVAPSEFGKTIASEIFESRQLRRDPFRAVTKLRLRQGSGLPVRQDVALPVPPTCSADPILPSDGPPDTLRGQPILDKPSEISQGLDLASDDFPEALRGQPILDKQARVMVEADLTVPGHPEIFVIGDLAHFDQDGKPLPGVAPVAMQQGRYAAEAIVGRLRGETPKPFHYHDKGSLAVIGRASGVADLGRLKFGGILAWLAWLFIHLMYLVQFRNRLIVFIRWGFQFVMFDRGARLITGDSPQQNRD